MLLQNMPLWHMDYFEQIILRNYRHRLSLIAQLVKNPPAMQETLVGFLGREDSLEKG